MNISGIGPGFVAIVGGIIALAMLAVAVSKNAQTASVFQGAGSALGSVIGAAVAPVSGNSSAFGSSANNVGGASH